jgi:hypothetical protein
MNIRWRTQDERPQTDESITALIALLSDEGKPFVLDIHVWSRTHWVHEPSGLALHERRYWWLPEAELLEGLPA